VWIICGFPLVAFGVFLFFVGNYSNEDGALLIFALGTCWIIVGLSLLTNSKWSKTLAFLFWIPVLFAFPIGTIWGAVAMQKLRAERTEIQNERKAVLSLSDDEIADLLDSQVQKEFSIDRSGWGESLRDRFKVAPVELSNFLDYLHERFRLPISEDDYKKIFCVRDILTTITERRNKSNQQE
jgi:hypothetical protein